MVEMENAKLDYDQEVLKLKTKLQQVPAASQSHGILFHFIILFFFQRRNDRRLYTFANVNKTKDANNRAATHLSCGEREKETEKCTKTTASRRICSNASIDVAAVTPVVWRHGWTILSRARAARS